MPQETVTIDIDRVLDLIQEYGQRSMDVGFFEKGTTEYSESFKEMIYAYADLLCLLKGKEPPTRE